MENNEYFILGIEGTAHTLGISIIDNNYNILADQRSTFKPQTGGIHPREAGNHIIDNFQLILEQTLLESNLSSSDISAIAFSQGPGLGPCLRATATSVRSLSLAINRPIIGINHPVAHIELGKQICEISDPLTLYVSGGNTQVAIYNNNKYVVLGETHDIAIGNLIDQTARAIGYDYALAGPIVEQNALESERSLLKLPYSVKGTSVHYSGLMTAAIKLYKEGNDPKNICYSLQEYAFSMLAEIVEKSLILSEKKEILLTGGVAANERLREMINLVAIENEVNFVVVPKNLAGDNGVMIAIAGKKYWDNGFTTDLKVSDVKPKWRLDEAFIPW